MLNYAEFKERVMSEFVDLDANNGTSVMTYSDMVSIYDVVSYQGLQTNMDYLLTGTLINKSTGEPIKDESGNPVQSSVSLNASNTSGTVTVEFLNVYIPYEITEVVVFERLYSANGELLMIHEDLEDNDQTITRALLETSAEADTTGKALMMDSTANIVDKVDYCGLNPGTSYVVEATLYKSTGELFTVNGQPVTSCVELVPENANGTIDVPLAFETAGLVEGDVVVVFESVKDIATQEEISAGTQSETVEISRHADLQSKTQSLTVKSLPATGERLSHYMIAGAASAITGCVGMLFIRIRYRKKDE